ncbi:MAG: hypothetical protein U0270_22930 [Labilithrix sp.]
MRRGLVIGVVLLGVLACGGGNSGGASVSGTSVKDEGFSHACASDEDCVVAYFGNTCGLCVGSNASVSKSAEASWQQAYNTARGHCPSTGAVGKCAARFGVARCEQKVCTFVDCGNQSPADEHHCRSDAGTDGGH